MLKSRSLLGKNRRTVAAAKPVHLKGKQYSSVKLRKKKHCKSASIADTSKLWKMSSEDLDQTQTTKTGVRTSEIHERDMFLDLLSQVQDNRYDNQRYTLKAGSVTDESNPEEELKVARSVGSPDTIVINGSLPNGRPGSFEVPYIEISPTTESPPKGESYMACEVVDDQTETVDRDSSDQKSLSISPVSTSTTLTPGRQSMEALRKVIAHHSEGPYPMLIEPPDGGFWIQNGEYESAKGADGVWTAPEIDTEHYTIQTDKTAFVYGRYFMGREHQNYIARDSKVGPVLLSVKTDVDYQGTLMRTLLRTQKATYYKTTPISNLPSKQMEPEHIIKYFSALHGDELSVEKAIRFDNAKVSELIRKFDEHPVAKTHKFGVIYQACGQTSEEEIFGNKEHPSSFDEFLDMFGDKVKLKGFAGYRGGLDVSNDQTGEYSVYTEYKDRQIMFHVSTLLPHDASDTQHVQRKRHIGNDIVVIVFQDKNTPFCPKTVRSHFVHCYIVVQVEHPHTDHTVYKVALTAKEEVPDFSPPLPDPAVFQKGPEFKDWLLTKLLNAEFNCHSAPDFKRLATRTRNQLFLHLVEDIALTLDDVESSSLAKRYVQSLQENSLSASRSTRRWRRRTLAGIFTTKDKLPFSSKRKSIADSPRSIRKMLADGRLPAMFIGSTPDLSIVSEQDSKSRDSPPANFMESLACTEAGSLERTVKANGSQGDIFMSKMRRRLTLKGKEKDPEKAKRKKPKRTASMDATTGLGMRDLFRRRKDSATNSPAAARRKLPLNRGTSEDSFSNETNWSIPYDLQENLQDPQDTGRSLENILFSESAEYRNKWRSTPTILERQESESGISISGVRMSINGPLTADVAIQVGNDCDDPVFKFPSPTLPNGPSSERRMDNTTSKIYDLNQVFPRSLPNTPTSRSRRPKNVLRKLPTKEEVYAGYVTSTSDSIKHMLKNDPNSQQQKKQSHHKTSLPHFTSSEMQTTDDKRPASSEDFSNDQYATGVIFRADSTESISSEADEVYDAVMHSLQALKAEVGRLNELNLHLSQQNVKFASQNRRLKIRHFDMKQQLEEAQEEIMTLHLKLKLYQPDFTQDGDADRQ